MANESYSNNMKKNLITQAVKLFITAINTILFAKVLGVENRGLYSYIVLIIGLGYDYGHFGINIVSSIYLKDKRLDKKSVFNTNFKFLIISSGLISLVLFILRAFNVFLVGYSIITVLAGGLLIITTMLSYYIINCYIAEEKLYYVNKFMIIQVVAEFIINIIMIFLGKFTIESIIVNRFITYFIMLIVITYKLKANTSHHYSFNKEFNFDILKIEFSNSIAAYTAAILVYLNYRVDQFMIKPELGIVQLGIYTLGVSLAEMVFLIPNSIGSAFLGKLVNCNEEEKHKLTVTTMKISFYLSLIIVIVGVIGSPLIPFIYGKAYTEAVEVTIILLLGTVVASFGKVLSNVYMSRGLMKVELLFGFLSFIINVVLNIFLIPRLGIIGSAIASTIAYIIYGGLYLIKYSRECKEGIFSLIKIEKEELIYIKRYFKKN